MDSDVEDLKMKKKKQSKKGETVPTSSLGFKTNFHADIIDPRNFKRSTLRSRTTRRKFVSKSKKQNFMSRLRVVVDVHDLGPDTESHLFKVTSKAEWKFVKKVNYRSREPVHCYICLEDNIVAPQITYCGHIYCFHCILMHFMLSTNCFYCPVCKQLIDKSELKTCQPKQYRALNEGDDITFSLKYRQGNYVFDGDTLREDLRDTHVIRMRPQGLLPIFQQEQEQIRQELEKTEKTNRNLHYLTEALTMSTQRVSACQERCKLGHIGLRENQIMRENIIYRTIDEQIRKKLIFFYQEESGNFIFLHKIAKKYFYSTLDRNNLPLTIKSSILEKDELDFSLEDQTYNELSIFNIGDQVDVVIVDVKELVDSETYAIFQDEVTQFCKIRDRIEKEQQVQLNRLRIEYEAEQKYIQKLKEQQQSKYYFDVKLPPTLEPCEIVSEQLFPSLFSTKSESVNKLQQAETELLVLNKNKTESARPKQKEFNLTNKHEEFPDISQLSTLKSDKNEKNEEKAKITANKNGKKKKKSKFVDMTYEMMFKAEEQDDY